MSTNNTLPPFSQIQPLAIEPQLDALLQKNRQRLDQLLSQQQLFSWDNLLQPLEEMDDELSQFWAPVRHLNAVANSESWRAVYKACLPKITEYSVELHQNTQLFQAINTLAESEEYSKLVPAQKKVIDHALRDFRLAGVHLEPAIKQKFMELDKQLSALQTQFQENLLDATQGWTHLVTDESELVGIPAHALSAARQSAKEKQLEGWLFTLEMPSYEAVITYADSQPLREMMYTAYVTRASDQGPQAGHWDNSGVMQQILEIRQEMAKLLGFANYSELSLANKMARSPEEVLTFLQQLADASLEQAREEFIALKAFVKEVYDIDTLQAWDVPYYSEKLRQKAYQVSKEDFRPYFAEDQVLAGLFAILERLYGVRVVEETGVDVWREEVRLFSFYDENKQLRGQCYIDLYARSNKRGGAWMDECKHRWRLSATQVQTPVAFVTCNFNGPVGEAPALLTHDDVTTLFHEFGHALQHILTQVDYLSVSGINGIPWDAVEIASQFMESWCWEKPGVDLIAQHYQTANPLPTELFAKLIKAKNFQSAMQMIRQLQFALFDFRLHLEFDSTEKNQIQRILDEVRQQFFIFSVPSFNRFQHGFAHIFAGGYAAGYYSYKWAELLACDAFSKFEENGIFDRETGRAFLHTLLESGGAVEPMDVFIQFRGRAPRIDALLRANGIHHETRHA